MAANVLPLKTAIGRWARDVHSTALDDMPDRMRPYAPLGKQVPGGRTPGELRKSIRRDRRITSFSAAVIHGRIEAPVVQAKTTDQGALPHRIYSSAPNTGGVLAFFWPGAPAGVRVSKRSGMIIVKWVNHPGNTAKPWWKRALNATYGPALRFASIRTPFRR